MKAWFVQRMLGVAGVALLLVGSGCTFSRAVVNPQVKRIDTSWIRPGVTTRRDVIRRIGMPPTVRELGGVRPDSFRWTTYDVFGRQLEGGYILTPTFKDERENFAHDILICFDENGIVNLVSRTAHVQGEGVKILEWREK